MGPQQDRSASKALANGTAVAPERKDGKVVHYKECQRNHAAGIGGYAVDGCREFMASRPRGRRGAPLRGVRLPPQLPQARGGGRRLRLLLRHLRPVIAAARRCPSLLFSCWLVRVDRHRQICASCLEPAVNKICL
uniref:Uncharacterized protein n=1 Tax=Aegilops tauschii TaxID=37682 RepID=M8ASB2_AEGTA